MKFKIYVINRYSSLKQTSIKDYSGYEQIVKYSKQFIPTRGNAVISKLIFRFLKIEKPKDYNSSKSSEELFLFCKALITGNPVFYLYADKDAFLLPLLKRKYKLKRIKFFGTLHWPEEISQDFSFYKHNLAAEFNGIITLTSSLNPGVKNRCVIPHGIHTFFWKNEMPLQYDNQYLILGISNRDHPGQLEVIKKIKQLDPSAKFILLIQDKRIYDQYKDISEIKIIDKRVSDDRLKELYSNSKAVILIQNHCLASNVVLECISMQVPILANRVGDIEEYLGKEYPLYLGDFLEQEKLSKISHFPDFRREVVNYMGQIRDNFEWKAIADKTVDFIENNLSR